MLNVKKKKMEHMKYGVGLNRGYDKIRKQDFTCLYYVPGPNIIESQWNISLNQNGMQNTLPKHISYQVVQIRGSILFQDQVGKPTLCGMPQSLVLFPIHHLSKTAG